MVMCASDEARGRRFLPYQLSRGTELDTKRRFPVTGGFQPGICRECRGLPPEAHPKAPIPGHTSKIRRYYWRELLFREMELFAEWVEATGVSEEELAGPKAAAASKDAERQALHEIKLLHRTTPKYAYQEESQAQVIEKYDVEIIDLKGEYVKTEQGKKARIRAGEEFVSAEEFACRYFSRLGYDSISTESIPFHVLFGVYMWLVIQDSSDPQVRMVGFGDRTAVDAGVQDKQIWTLLPDDFGSPGYEERRRTAIDDHLSREMQEREELEWLFDYWLEPSQELRQYLWAHREKDIETARRLIEVLPAKVICDILRYLVGDYWRRYTGWPDLLVYRGDEFLFAEVKSSGDKLSEDQKNWIRDNASILKLPFKIVKIHRG